MKSKSHIYQRIVLLLMATLISWSSYGQCAFTNLSSEYCSTDVDFTLSGGTNYYGPGVTGSTFSPSTAGAGIHRVYTTDGIANTYNIVTAGTFNRLMDAGTILPLTQDDDQSVALPFSFNFFGNSYNSVRIGSNLIVGFTDNVSTGTNRDIPNNTNPDNIIAAAWDAHDIDAGTTIKYFVTGTTPNRIFVIDYDAVPRDGAAYDNTVQIQLHETSNIIEIHSTYVGFGTGGNFGSQGIENSTASVGYVVSGRDNEGWDATNEYIAFVPSCTDIKYVTVREAPTTADAGNDIGQCNNSTFTLSANTPVVGTGIWSIESGPGALTNASSPTTTVTGVTAGDGSVPTVVRWTVSNGLCTPSFEDINLRNYTQIVVDAGSDLTICEGSSTPLGGSPTASGGDGNYIYLWTPTPDLSDATASNPNATPTADATYTLTVNGGSGCSDVDVVDINVTPAPTADGGVADETCEDTPYVVNDAAATNFSALGWSHNGAGNITNGNTINPTYTPDAADAGNTVTLTLTVTGNGSCGDAVDTKAIDVLTVPTADAGLGGDECDLTFLFGATPSVGTGTWSQQSGPGTTTFNNANSPNATATASAYGTYVYRWTELNGVCSDFEEVTVNYYAQPVANITAGSGSVCGLLQNVTAVLSTGTGGTWSQVSGPGTISFGSLTGLSTTATADAYGSYVVRWTEDNNVCSGTDEITINYYESPTADAGLGGDECDLTFLFGATPSVGTGTWSQQSGPGTTTFNNANSPNATATASAYGTYVYRWTELNGVCSDFEEVTVNYYAQPVANITAGSGSVCGLLQNVTAVLSTGTGGTWSQVSGPGTISFGSLTGLSTTATADAYGSYVVRWTEDNNVCSGTDEITINYYESPTADAGLGGDECDLTFLFGATPSVGTGTWSQQSGPGTTTFNNANSPNATATASAYGTYVYRWTELNGVCSDFEEVTVNYYAQPVANITAGSGSVCGLLQNVTAVLSTGTGGTWSQVSGPGTISFGSLTGLSTTATADAYGSYVVRWTEDNNVCSGTDEITINYYESPTADAGLGGDECDLTFLFGATPSVGTGTWSQQSGPGTTTFNNANSPNATATASAYGTYVYRWTELNGVCSDFEEVTVNYYAQPVANITAGSGSVCGLLQNVTAVLSTGTGGTWSQVSGPGTISFGSLTGLSTTATADAYGSYVVRWTEDNNVCSGTDEITINYYESPTADAGLGGDECDLTFLFGATPSVGTGTWSQQSGPGTTTFNNANSPNATATASAYGTYVYRWTELNGVCSDFEEVTVNYYAQPVANITAGSGSVCGLLQNVTAVLSTGTGGTWSQVSGPGTISFGSLTGLSTTATADAYGSYVVRWTEDNNVCSGTDEITINYYESPTADAGLGGDECDLTFLFGATPSVGTGTWSQQSGPGTTTFNNANSPNATATASAYGTYVYRWTELNGVCSDFEEVTVNYYAQPVANITAGSGSVCGLLQNVTAVLSTGTGGTWSQVSGPGTISFGSLTGLSTTATADAYGSYVVRWTEDNNVCSGTDEITINYYESPTADAGLGGDECDLTFLFGATPSVGTGTWSQQSGPGTTTFNNANSPNATATASAYGTYVYRWTELNGVCSDFEEVTVNYYAQPVANITAGSGSVCGLLQNVTAVLSTGTGGTWSQVSGPGTISFGSLTGLSTTATADAYGSYVVRWTEDNNVCSGTDEITINYYESPTADAGLGGDECDLTFLFGATPSVGTGTWSQQSGPGTTTFNNANSPNATATASAYGTYVYRWTELNGVCSDFEEVTVNYYAQPVANITAGSGSVCGLLQNVTAVLSTGTGGTWSQVSGPGTISFGSLTGLSTTATADAYGSYVVRWTEDNNVCSGTDEITINYYESPTADAGLGGDECDLTFLFGATPSVGTGTWSQQSGPGTTTFNNANSPNATATASAYGTYVYRWTELNGVCSDFEEVTVNYYAQPVANITAGSGSVCGLLQNVTAVLSTGTGGTWSQVSGPGTISFGSLTGLSTTATADAYGSYVVRWTEDNNVCSGTDEITINYYESPTADAGLGGDECDLTFLFGATPSVGTGTWSQQSGPGTTTFNNANSPNATATASAYGTYVYRWTELNGVCSDFEEVTVNYYAQPVANITAGSGSVCGLLQNVTAVLSTGTGGTWSQVSGPGTISFGSLTGLSTTATADAYGSYVVRWTEDNNVCSGTDEITINYYESPTADAGLGGDECDLTFLFGATPSVGTGTWSQQSGPGTTTFNNANSPNATATASAYGTYVYRWTELNGVCSDFEEVTVNYYAQPVANITAGSGSVCGLLQNVTAVLSTGTGGTWSQVSGPGTISFGSLTGLSTTATADAYGSYVVRWTEDNNVCSGTDEITINYYESPTADAGLGGDECDLTFLFGATPSVGTGTWSQQSGPGTTTFNNANSPNATATASAYGTYVYRWTELNGVCSDFEEVTVNYYAQPVANITAGSGSVCGLLQNVTAVLSTGTGGTWSQVSGPGTISFGSLTGLSTTATADAYGSYVVRWTEDNNVCSGTDEITINYYESPTADAGLGGDECDLTFLFGATPSVGTGTWSQQSGPGTTTFNNANSPNATATASAYGTYVYRWTELNGVCSDFEEVTVNYYAQPVASAGIGGDECDFDYQFGAVLSTSGTGVWSKVSGPIGESYDDATSETATVTVTNYGSYVFRWTETNGVCSDFEDVTVNFYEPPTIATVGPNQNQCSDDIFVLTGNNPVIGSGIWTVESGVASITNPTLYNTTITGVPVGTTAVLRWTIGNGVCASSFADLSLTNNTALEQADAGSDEIVCGSAILDGNLPGAGSTGTWSILPLPGNDGLGVIADINDPKSGFDGTSGETYVLRWTISNGGICTDTFDDVSIEFDENTDLEIISANPAFCEGGITDITLNILSGTGPITLLSVDYGGGDITGGVLTGGETFIDGQKISETLFNSINNNRQAVYTFEVAGGICVSSGQSVAVTVFPTPVMSITNTASNICSGEVAAITLNTPTENGQILVTAVNYGSVTPSGSGISVGQPFNDGDQITETLTNATNTIQQVSYTFEVEGNGCGPVGGFTTTIDVKPIPTMSITDANGSFCEGGATNITLNTPTQGGVIRVTDVDYSGGNVTGGSITIGQTFTDGQKITETLFTNTDNVEIVTYTFEVDAGGCGPIGGFSESVTVRPTPVMSITNSALNICSGEDAAITLNTPTENGQIRVTAVNYGSVTPSGSGISVGQPFNDGDQITETLTNATNTIQQVSYTFEVEGNGCGPVGGFTTTIDVNPEPTMTVVNTNTTINSGAMTDILLNTPTQNGQVRLKSVTKPAGISGNTVAGALFPDNTRLEDVLTNSTNGPLMITYEFEVIANGCVNTTTISESVTVNPSPQMTVLNNAPVLCSEDATNIFINSVTANAIIKLIDVTVDPAPAGVTGNTLIGTEWGLGFDPLPVTLNDNLENTTNDIQTVTYTFEVSASGFVSTTTKTAIVTVNPKPSMTVVNTNTTINSGQMTDILLSTPTQNGQVRLKTVSKPVEITGNTIQGVLFPNGARLEDILVNTASIPQTISYEFEAVGNGCTNTTTIIEDVLVVPVADMTLTNNSPSICSDENTDIILTSSTSGAVIELVAINTTPTASSVSGITALNTTWSTFPANITDNLLNPTSSTQKVEYVFEVSAGGYTNPVTQSVFVDVKPLPNIDALAPDICSGTVTNVDIWNPNSVTFTVFNWEVSNVNGVITGESDGSGNRITQLLTNNSSSLDFVTYRVFATAQSCKGDSIDVVQNVYPQNIADAGTDVVVCQGTPPINIETASIGGGATTASWAKISGGGTLTNTTGLIPTYTPSPADEVGTITLELTASNASVCPPVTDLVSIIINSSPTVQAGIDQVICEGESVLLSGAVIGGSTTSVTWSGGLGTFSPNATTLNATYIPDASEVGTTVTLTITTNDPVGPCDAVSDQIDITINDAPEVFAGGDQILCEGDVALLGGATQGGSTSSITWTGGLGSFDDITLLNATYTPDPAEIGGVVILTINSNDPGAPCNPVSDQIRITVNKAPEVFAGIDKTICEGESVLIGDATTGGSTTSVTWSGGSGTFSPNATTLNATYTPDASEVGSTVTLTLTTNDPAGPCGAVNDQVDITINDAPEVFAGGDQTICEGDVAVLSSAIQGGSTTSVTWTGGLGSFDNINLLNATYTPDQSEIGSVVILTVTSNDPAGPCNPVNDQIRITVNKAPEVFAGTDMTICEGESYLIVDATTGGSTTSVTWTGGLGAFSPNATTLNAIYTPDASEVGTTVSLTVTTNDPTGPCGAVSDQIDITINDAPEVFAGGDQTICEGDVALLSSATVGGSTSSITWTGGLGSFDDINLLSATYTPDLSEIGSVVILTITSNDPAGPCDPVSDQIRITVNKAPEVFAGADMTICEGESYLIGDATTGGSTTSVTWTGGIGTFSPNPTTLNATYIPDASEVGTSVTLTVTTNDPSGPCIAISDQLNITIDQAPTVDAGIYAPVCIGDTVQLNGVVGGSATSGFWTGGDGEFLPNRNALNAKYIASSAEDGTNVLLVLTTNNPTGVCNAIFDQSIIIVNSLPSPRLVGLDDAYQVDDPSVNLTGFPDPGIFSGPGIIGNTFLPAVADTGTHVIRYTHTDGNGCTDYTEKSTIVFALPPVEIGNPGPFCLLNETTDNILPRTTDPNLTDSWGGDNVSSGGGLFYFNSEAAGVGLHEITYTVVDNTTGAITNESRFVTVNDVARVDFTNINKCIADTIQFVDLSVLPDSAVFSDYIESWNWEFGSGADLQTSSEQNPRILFELQKPDDYFVRLEVRTKVGKCTSFFSKDTIKVGAVPNADFIVKNLTLDAPTEFNNKTAVPTTGFATGYNDPTSSIDSIWWDFGDGNSASGRFVDFNPYLHQYTSGSSFNVSMEIKTNLGCYDDLAFKINIISINDTFPHIETFNDYTGGEFEGTNASWQLMPVPKGSLIDTGDTVWVTSNSENRHNDNEHSFVSLEAFDIRGLSRPMLKLDIWSNAESTRDGASLQYSFDGGTWNTLVDPNDQKPLSEQIGVNWYDERGLVSRPGNVDLAGSSGLNSSGFGWTGVYSGWKTTRFPLDDIRDEMNAEGFASVRFRVVFSSDQQNPDGTTYDGIAFDNLWIGDRTHNVLLEHFDNLSGGNKIELVNEKADQFNLDMIPLQYHTKYPSEDVIYGNNKFPVETRGSIFDINQSPRAFMDGIKEYDFSGANIEDYQIINRSLIDPKFDIQVGGTKLNQNSVELDITVTANDTLSEEVTIYAIPIETSIVGLSQLGSLGIDSLNNIAKDMLPSGGLLVDQNWQVDQSYNLQLTWDLNKLNKENEIYEPTKLGVVVFVQNAVNEGSREIYQAVYQKLPVIQNTIITGLEDELNAKRIENADIYPNPADYYFNVALTSELTQDMDYVIIDQRGVELLKGNFAAGEDLYEVDANTLPNGLHMMIFSGNDDYHVIRKIIISR